MEEEEEARLMVLKALILHEQVHGVNTVEAATLEVRRTG